jgi:hypothetical protein
MFDLIVGGGWLKNPAAAPERKRHGGREQR